MKRIILMTAFPIVVLAACNDNSKQANAGTSDTAQSTPTTTTEPVVQPPSASPVKEIVHGACP